MTTGFIPCSAKMPIVGLVAGALFGGNALIATASYFIGIGAVVLSGVILKKTKAFMGEPAPFVMELPNYHMPIASNVFRTTWERGWSFIKRAGTVIFAASVIIWVLNSLTFDGGFHYITEQWGGTSILEYNVLSEEGPEHKKVFTVEAKINNNVVGTGSASTKKDAEMLAAKAALTLFGMII